METPVPIPVEGQLYKVIQVDRHRFELRYGYNEDYERQHCHPVVLFPDLDSSPVYTQDGLPIVTAVQDPCRHYCVPDGQPPEQWCADCVFYPNPHQEIGICCCEMRRLKQTTDELLPKEELL